jgi:hypothetical protein
MAHNAMALFLSLFLPSAVSLMVTVRNDVPRVDQYGHIINAHDGSVVNFLNTPWAGTYFMYGTVYENCTQDGPQCDGCGYNPNTFALYTTTDMVSFTFHSANILPEASKDNKQVNYWMPVVYYNQKTATFVMQYWSGRCGFANPCADMAVSASPYGPFKMVPPIALRGGTPSSQMGFFVDPGTQKAFVKYNTHPPDQHHSVEALSDDWLSSTGEWAVLLWKPSFAWMEGGGMFKRGDLYYYMTGTDCCYCVWGGDARYWTSYHPLGPWHPGVAPPLPTEPCDLSGSWQAVAAPGKGPGNESLTLKQAAGSANFTFTDAQGSAAGWIDQATGFITFPPSAGDGRGVVTSADGAASGCDRIRWYGYESFIWCREGKVCAQPTYLDAPEVCVFVCFCRGARKRWSHPPHATHPPICPTHRRNYCQDGSMPNEGVRVNPCDSGVPYVRLDANHPRA